MGRGSLELKIRAGVAWFIIAAVLNKKISIYGDGKQIRDALYVEDLVAGYDAAIAHIEQAAGQVYNVGGGPENIIAIWSEFGPMLEELVGHVIPGDTR